MIRRLAVPAIALALTATLAACGSDDHTSMADTTTATQAPGGSTPTVTLNAADIEFAQGMIAHHEQAIEMAEIALDPKVGASPEVLDLATRIKGARMGAMPTRMAMGMKIASPTASQPRP